MSGRCGEVISGGCGVVMSVMGVVRWKKKM